ncbi:MAG: hypothetical protein ACO1O1_15155 [Adhaeribacter sp.]
MPFQPALEAKLARSYPPDATIAETYRGKDLTIITNDMGQAVTCFIGKRKPDGSIAGERYVRRLQYQADGITIRKSHWDLKGKVSRA